MFGCSLEDYWSRQVQGLWQTGTVDFRPSENLFGCRNWPKADATAALWKKASRQSEVWLETFTDLLKVFINQVWWEQFGRWMTIKGIVSLLDKRPIDLFSTVIVMLWRQDSLTYIPIRALLVPCCHCNQPPTNQTGTAATSNVQQIKSHNSPISRCLLWTVLSGLLQYSNLITDYFFKSIPITSLPTLFHT